MLLRNRERRSRSSFALAIIASISLVFVGSFAIIHRVAADKNNVDIAIEAGLVLGIHENAAPSAEACADPNSDDYYGYGIASTYEKSCFFKRYNELGALGSFHLIGLNQIDNIGWGNGAIYGNITTRSFTNVHMLGVSNLPEINYISDTFSPEYNFFSNSGQSIVVLGDDIMVRPLDNINIRIGTANHMREYPIGGWNHTFWQDYEAKFLDMDTLRNEAIQYNVETYNRYQSLDPNDEENSNIAMGEEAAVCTSNGSITCNITNNDKISFVNVNASDWNNGSFGTITINNAGPKKTFLINIDAKGVSNLNFGGVNVNLSDSTYNNQPLQCFNSAGTAQNVGSSINDSNFACYSETAETNIVFNIYDSTNTNNNYQWTGTISGNRVYGMIVAPSATVANFQAIRGTVIANSINNIGNTYQSNFYGRLVVFPKVTVYHRNPDGTQFTYPGVDTSEQVFTINTMDYEVYPVDLGNDTSYTITVSEDGYPSSGQTPEEDFEVIFIYTKENYHLTVNHVDENGNTFAETTTTEYAYGSPYTTSPISNADIAAGYYDIEVIEGDAAGVISGDTVVTYQYTRKKATFQVYHKAANGDDLAQVDPELILYGNPYSASPIEDLLDEYNVSPTSTVSGIVSDATVDDPEAENKTLTVTFTYTRKQFDLTVIHIVDGSEISNNTTHDVNYGTSITTDAFLDAYPAAGYTRSVSVNPDGATTVTTNTTITYTYTIKQFKLTTKHIIDGVENEGLGTQTDVNYNTDVPTNGCLAAYAASHTCEVSVSPDGAAKVTQDTTVTYTYTRKQFNLTITHIVDGETISSDTTSKGYGYELTINAYLDAYPADAYVRSVTVNPEGATTVTQNTTITYTYNIKKYDLTVIHIVDGETISSGTTHNVAHGTSITTDEYLEAYPATAYNRSVSVNPNGATTVTSNTIITYTYTIKQFKLTVKHVVNGTEVEEQRTENDVNYGTPVPTDAYLDAYPATAYTRSVTVNPDGATTVTQNTTVTYSYIIKQFKLTIKHVVNGTEILEHHSENDVNYGTPIATNAYLDAYPAEAYTRSVTVNPDGATTVTQATTVTYTYAIKQFKLTVKHVVDGTEDMDHHTETDVDYGTSVTTDAYLDTYPAAAYNRSVSVNPDGATAVTSATTVTYTYTIKKYDVTVIHIVDGETISSDTTNNVNYGTPVVTNAYLDAYPEVAYERSVSVSPDGATTVTANTTITYTYNIRKYDVTIIHVVDGVEKSRTTTANVNYGTSISTDEYLDAYPAAAYIRSVTVNPEGATTVTANTTITYTYTIKQFTLTIKHVIDGAEDMNHHTENNVNYNTDVPTDGCLAAYAESHTCTVTVSPEGATKVTQATTVTYTYTIKQFKLTIRHVINGVEDSDAHSETDVNYGTSISTDEYLDAYPAVNYERSVSVNPTNATTVTQATTVTYTYNSKTAVFQVIHKYADGTTISSSEPETIAYGNPYSASPIAEMLVEYDVNPTGTISGTVSDEALDDPTAAEKTITVVFTYTKKQFGLTITHIVNGETISSDTTQVEYGTPISTDAYLDAYPAAAYARSVTVNPDGATTVTQATTVTYTYAIKKFDVTVIHVVDGETISNDTTHDVDYGTPIVIDAYLDTYPETAYVRSVSVSPEGATTVTTNTTITYTYNIRKYDVTVIHIVDGAEESRATTTNVNYGTPISTDAYLDTYPETAYTRSVTVNPEGATAVTQNTTITYNYTIKQFKLTVKHVVDGVEDMEHHAEADVDYGTPISTDAYLDTYPAAAYTRSVTVNPSGATTVTQATTVTYTYNIKKFDLTVIHIVDGSEISNNTTHDVNYGTSITTDAFLDAYPAAGYTRSVSVNPEGATTVTQNTTITYTYTIKQFKLTTKHIVDGTEDENLGTQTDVNYNTDVPTNGCLATYAASHACEVSVNPEGAAKVTQDTTVTYIYTRKQFDLTITHIVDVETVSSDTTSKGYGYELTTNEYLDAYPAEAYTRSVSVNPEGATTVTQNTTITYTYNIKKYTVTTVHIVNSTEESRIVSENVPHGTAISTTEYLTNYPENLYARSVTVSPANATQVTSDTTITYNYVRKTASLQVYHKDTDGEDLITVEPQTVNYGDSYSASPAASLLDEYDVSPATTVSGTVSDETVDNPAAEAKTITVTFTYTRKTAKVIARHVDGNGTKLRDDVIQDGQPWSGSYVTVPHPDLTTNYSYTTDKSETGIISSETVNADRELIVTYTYTRKSASLIVIHQFVTGDTNLTHTDSSTVYYGDSYSASPISTHLVAYNVDPSTTVSGIVSDSTVDDATATDKTITITFTYTIKTYTLTVLHENADGTKFNNGANDTTASGKEHGSHYETSRVVDQNYDASLKAGSDADSGDMDSDKTVIYVYTRKVATITARHIDANGNNLKDNVTQQVAWGDTYTTVPHPELTTAYNYTVEGSESDVVAGDVTVIYKYTKKRFNLTVHHVKANGDEFSADVITPYDYGDPYEAAPIIDQDYDYSIISGEASGIIYGPTSVTYEYTKKKGTLTVKHQDTNGNPLAATSSRELDYGTPYTVYPDAELTTQYNYSVNASETGVLRGNVTIIYTYTKKAYILTVHHKYESGAQYQPDVNTDYEHGDTYTAVPDTSDNNYEYYLKEGDSASGPITSNLEVTYFYKKKIATFTVKHQNASGGELAPTESTPIEWGERYTAHPSASLTEAYDYTTDKPESDIIKGDVTVTYTYTKKRLTLTVHHRLENGNEYKPDVATPYDYGDTYTAVPDTSDENYEYRLATGDSASDIITANTEVTYIYKKKIANFVVKHQDTSGGELAPTESTPIEWGERYTAHPSSSLTTAYDYTADKSETGTIKGDITITYTYTKKIFNITVHHVYADGSEFAADDTTTVEYGGSYTAVAKVDPSYNSIVTEGALVNENITNHVVITIKYILKKGHIVVKHLDENGGELAEEESFDVDYGSSYSVSPKESLLEANDVSADVAESDTVSGDVTITYTYSRKHYTITVHHLLENGDQYKPDDILPYRHGDQYTITSDTSNYSYDARLGKRASTSGIITSNLEITFVYFKKKATFTVRHLDKDGNPLIADEETILEYDEGYTAHPASSLVTGYDYTVDSDESGIISGDVTVTYTYTKKKFIITIHHIGKDGEALAEDEEIEVEYGDVFTPSGLADLLSKYDFVVDPDTPIPEIISGNINIRLIYTEKPEVPQTYDDIIAIVSAIAVALIGTSASLFIARRRHS